jgi:hypothetical protein
VHVSFIRAQARHLVTVERQRGVIGGLPEQDWSLRVTWVFGRTEAAWELAHRHADPLVHPSSPERPAVLGRLGLKRPDKPVARELVRGLGGVDLAYPGAYAAANVDCVGKPRAMHQRQHLR